MFSTKCSISLICPFGVRTTDICTRQSKSTRLRVKIKKNSTVHENYRFSISFILREYN